MEHNRAAAYAGHDPARYLEARRQGMQNVLTRWVGMTADWAALDPQVLDAPDPLAPGDALVLCSDGLDKHVTRESIARAALALDARPAATRLVALANDRGGSDHIAVAVLQTGSAPAGPRRRRAMWAEDLSGAWERHRAGATLMLLAGLLAAAAAGATLVARSMAVATGPLPVPPPQPTPPPTANPRRRRRPCPHRSRRLSRRLSRRRSRSCHRPPYRRERFCGRRAGRSRHRAGRALPPAGGAGQGGHGHRLSGRAAQRPPPGGDQGGRSGPGPPAHLRPPVPAGGGGPGPPGARPRDPARLRRGRRGGAAVPGDAPGHGGHPQGPPGAGGRPAVAAPAGPASGAAGAGRAGVRPRAGLHPPRRQAQQHPPGRGAGLPLRLRDRQAPPGGLGPDPAGHPHRRGPDGHPGLHGPGAGPRPAGRPPGGRLRLRRGALRGAHRTGAVPGLDADAAGVQARGGGPAPAACSSIPASLALEAVLLRALARQPEQRFPTAKDFSEAYQQAVDEAYPAPRRVPTPLPAAGVPAPSGRRPRQAGARRPPTAGGDAPR